MTDLACLWMVVIHSDYSGTRVFEDKAKAIEHAKNNAAEYRKQTAVYRCTLGAVMVPKEPEMVAIDDLCFENAKKGDAGV